jgi:hypothetical protein
VLLIVGDVAAAVIILTAPVLIFSGMEATLERLTPLALTAFACGAVPRIVASARASRDPAIPKRARFDVASGYLVYPGWAASRYLRNFAAQPKGPKN